MKFAKLKGFTLIELMITVAIVGILSAIAYPSYTDHIRKGRRAELRTIMLESSQWLERFYTENQRYDKNLAGTVTTDAAVFYGAFKYSPRSISVPGSYELTLTVSSTTPNAYTLTAARAGNMADDKCGDYLLNQTGARGNVNYSGYTTAIEAARECWK